MKQISEQEMEQMQDAIWEEFLTHATQEEIFISANTINWDDENPYLLRWVLEHPEVDKATPLLLYWRTQPWYYHLPDYEGEPFLRDFVESVERKYVAGFWKENRIWLDPDETEEAIAIAPKLVRKIPEAMFHPLKGEMISEKRIFDADFVEGLPKAFSRRIFDLFDEYEVIAE
jgi:hypothetical protein